MIHPVQLSAAEVECLERTIDAALAEDGGGRDLTCDLLEAATGGRLGIARGRVIAKAPGVVAGTFAVEAACTRGAAPEELEGFALELLVAEGASVAPGDVVLRVAGSARLLHQRERILLNVLGRLSGIATATRRLVDEVARVGGRATILHTRKTTPGLRPLELRAVLSGGGAAHRSSLAGAALFKENHFATAGGLAYVEVLERAVKAAAPGTLIVAESESVDEAVAAAAAGVTVVMLDDLPLEDLPSAVARVRAAPRPAGAAPVLIEVSGGVRLATVAAIAAAGVDRISTGAVTHSAPQLDLSFLIDREPDGTRRT